MMIAMQRNQSIIRYEQKQIDYISVSSDGTSSIME